ncbi:hypothetical protein, partial [Pseudomonas sp. 18082547]|uniref:hypothetical protein n=1 Tax=Pseudomonas sp. 18082547 TaxID=2952257 RepID=UPI002157A5EC
QTEKIDHEVQASACRIESLSEQWLTFQMNEFSPYLGMTPPIRASKTCCRPAEALTVPTCDSFLYGNSVIIQFENDIARHIADATDVDLHMI